MPTKNTTQTTNAYNSGAMGTYNAFQPQIMSQLMQMASNPLGSTYFQNQLGQQMKTARQIGSRSNSNLLQNIRAGGGILSNSAGFMAGALNRNQATNNMMQSNAFNTSLNSALQNRNIAAASMEAYQPLQTGQTSVQSQSGLGTWLPQVAGMAMNMLAPGLGSMMGGQGFSAGYKPQGGGGGGMTAPPSTGYMQNPFGTGGGMQTAQMPY